MLGLLAHQDLLLFHLPEVQDTLQGHSCSYDSEVYSEVSWKELLVFSYAARGFCFEHVVYSSLVYYNLLLILRKCLKIFV